VGERRRKREERDLEDIRADDVLSGEEPMGHLVLVQDRVELRAADRDRQERG
jgi:hypothetical protein